MGNSVKDFVIGEQVRVRSEYRLEYATVVRIGRTRLLISVTTFGCEYLRSVELNRVVKLDEEVALVWELWKGTNGRGGYRVERELYPEKRKPAKYISLPNDMLWEGSYGVLRSGV